MPKYKKLPDEIIPVIAKEYVNGMSINALAVKYKVSYTAMNILIKSKRFEPYYKEAKLKEYRYDLNFKYNVNEILEIVLTELRIRLKRKQDLKKMDNKELYSAIKTVKEIISIVPLEPEEKDNGTEVIPFQKLGTIKNKSEKREVMEKIKNISAGMFNA